MIKNKPFGLTLLFTLSTALSNVALALPTEQNQLRIQTSVSKRAGETSFSSFVAWRKGDESLQKVNGLIFVKGFNVKKPSSDVDIARKTAKSINAAITNKASPKERGVITKYTKDKPEILLNNIAGFDLIHFTLRDYSNQKLQYNIPAKSFAEAAVTVAIDLVYSADVDYIGDHATDEKRKTAGGFIKVSIDGETIEIQTAGKSTQQLETELAEALGAKGQLSSTAIYPNYVELNSRNYKDFDGSEVQLLNLAAKSISIDIKDSGLGVLTKFNYPDENKPSELASKIPYIFGFVVLGLLGYVVFSGKKNKA